MTNYPSKNNTKEILTISVKLLVICSIVAVIIAFVNSITKDKIAYNEQVKTAKALSEIYSENFNGKSFEVNENEFIIRDGESIVAKCVTADCELISEDITGLYILTDGEGNSLGYCVAIEPMGFKDVIKMLVAVNSDLSVKDVKIVSMSETSGYGTKAKNDPNPPSDKDGSDWFLKQFTGMSENAFIKNAKGKYENVDTISSATKTSEPVIEAVEVSLKQVNAYHNSLGGASNE